MDVGFDVICQVLMTFGEERGTKKWTLEEDMVHFPFRTCPRYYGTLLNAWRNSRILHRFAPHCSFLLLSLLWQRWFMFHSKGLYGSHIVFIPSRCSVIADCITLRCFLAIWSKLCKPIILSVINASSPLSFIQSSVMNIMGQSLTLKTLKQRSYIIKMETSIFHIR